MAFAQIWIFQLKDEFWDPTYTAIIPGLLVVLVIVRSVVAPPPFNMKMLFPGICALLIAGFFFWLSLYDQTDP